MKKIFFIIFFITMVTEVSATIKENLIQNLQSINNITFKFEQNINGKIENGTCSIKYPKKIFCKYDLKNEKILVSNGNSLVIKTSTSYYLYPLDKTPLNLILSKDFLINKIRKSDERVIDDKYINYNFIENENEINVFFDISTYNFVGWQTTDMYQNLSITYLSSIVKNQNINKNIFKLPVRY